MRVTTSLLIASFAGTVLSEPLAVSLLSKHNPDAWSDDANCGEDGTIEYMQCNLRLYEQTISTAAGLGSELVIFPEAYGISGSVSSTSFIEPWVSEVGSPSPCDSSNANGAPAQYTLSCAARQYKLVVIANIFVALPNGTNMINTAVYDETGSTVVTYSKNHLFPGEGKVFTPGPFNPTIFKMKDYVFGLIICYEGVYPEITGDWSQMDALKAMGANTFAWSIGSAIPQPFASKILAEKYQVGVLASEDYTYATLLDLTGASHNATDYALEVEGNTGKAAVRFAVIGA
jgi:deaminated glutathione amidase